jgi:uncharacterized protein YggE
MGRAGALILAAVLLAACAVPMGATHEPGVIAAAGRGEVSVKPDTAIVRLGAEARRPTLAEATADVAHRMTAVLERVRAAGVRPEDIATTRYAVEPQMARRPGMPESEESLRIVGYRASNLFQIKVRDVTAVGRVADAAVAAGANVVQGVLFILEDRKAAESAARERAVASAQATAAQLAKAAGVRLGPLVTLTEGVAGPRPVTGREVMAMQTSGPGPIEAGELTIVVTVEARYRVE